MSITNGKETNMKYAVMTQAGVVKIEEKPIPPIGEDGGADKDRDVRYMRHRRIDL